MKLWWAATIGALVKRLNNYLSVVGDGSLSPLQPGFCRAAGCCRKACLCIFGLTGRTQSCAPQARAGSCLLELNLINFTYIVTSVTPRNVSFEERKIIFVVRVCGPEVLEEVGSSDAWLRGVFGARVMFLPKWGGSPPKLEAEWHP